MKASPLYILMIHFGWSLILVSVVGFLLLSAGDPECYVVPPDQEIDLELPASNN